MNLKQLKRQKPRAFAARKKTVALRRVVRAMGRLTAKALLEAGPEWSRIDMVDNELPRKPILCCVWAKKGEEPVAVPSGMQIMYSWGLQMESL